MHTPFLFRRAEVTCTHVEQHAELKLTRAPPADDLLPGVHLRLNAGPRGIMLDRGTSYIHLIGFPPSALELSDMRRSI
jgi:hypothetical protein